MTNPSELQVYQEDPSFDFDGDLEGGTNVPVAQDHSDISSPLLTPVGMTVRDERRLFRSAAGSSYIQGASGERERSTQTVTPTEYPAVPPGEGNPMQYSGQFPGQFPMQYPGQFPGQFLGQFPMQFSGQYAVENPVYSNIDVSTPRPLGYVPSGSVSSRPPVSRSNPLFGVSFSTPRPAGSSSIPHSQAVSMPPFRTQQPPVYAYRGAAHQPSSGVYASQLRSSAPIVSAGVYFPHVSSGNSEQPQQGLMAVVLQVAVVLQGKALQGVVLRGVVLQGVAGIQGVLIQALLISLRSPVCHIVLGLGGALGCFLQLCLCMHLPLRNSPQNLTQLS